MGWQDTMAPLSCLTSYKVTQFLFNILHYVFFSFFTSKEAAQGRRGKWESPYLPLPYSPRPNHVQELLPVAVKGRHSSLVAQKSILMDEVGTEIKSYGVVAAHHHATDFFLCNNRRFQITEVCYVTGISWFLHFVGVLVVKVLHTDSK